MVAFLFRTAAVAALTLGVGAAPVHAQDARPASEMRVAAHPSSAFVSHAGPGAAIRVTTYAQRPSVGARLDRWRGVRVFRDATTSAVAVPAQPAARVVHSPDGRFVRHGGATYPVVPR